MEKTHSNHPLAFLGYPEPDAGCPFGYLIPLEEGCFILSGIIHPFSQQAIEVESQIVFESMDAIFERFTEHGLHLVKKEYCVWWLCQALSLEQRLNFQELDVLLLTAQPQKPHFYGEGVDMKKANRLDALVSQDRGLFFLLSDELLEQGVKGLSVAMQNDPTIRHTIIEAVVESTADLAVNEQSRLCWEKALLSIALIYDAQGMEDALNAAEHNRRAFSELELGSQIPFVKAWTNQQLVNSIAIAQLMARDT